MTLSKEARAELRRRCPTPEETDALLDLADERDRYRALLVEAVDRVNDRLDAEENIGGAGERFDAWIDRIDAALEGKHEHQ